MTHIQQQESLVDTICSVLNRDGRQPINSTVCNDEDGNITLFTTFGAIYLIGSPRPMIRGTQLVFSVEAEYSATPTSCVHVDDPNNVPCGDTIISDLLPTSSEQQITIEIGTFLARSEIASTFTGMQEDALAAAHSTPTD
tara:strand:+ start:111 stop:530 length:420 start_codon:yes stop_codon:yes gene_type:complete